MRIRGLKYEMGIDDAGAPALWSAGPEDVAGHLAASLVWRRSTRCSSNSCVEVADLPDGGVAVRDSKLPSAAPALLFSAQEWRAFIAGVNAGEFG